MYGKTIYVDGDVAIKPYFYFRNGLLHVRFNVDRAIELSADESRKLKEELSKDPANKQYIMEKEWNLQTQFVGKPIIYDGIKAGEKRIKELSAKWTKESNQ